VRAVLCFGDLKQAALYFDRVLPISLRRIVGADEWLFYFPEEVPVSALMHLVFGQERYSPRPHHDWYSRLVVHWDTFRKITWPYIKVAAEEAGLDFSERATDRLDPSSIDRHQSLVADLLRDAYLRDVTIPSVGPIRSLFADYAHALGLECSDALLGSGEPTTTGNDELIPILSLTRIPLIDLANVEWVQILQIRCDDEARRKLQRLRAFVVQEYAGKSVSFIEDDLGRRLWDYEIAAKKHGFKMITGSISALLDAKTLQSAVCAGVAAALFGGATVGVGTGAVVEVGKVALELKTRRREMLDWKSSHELAYIIDVQSSATAERSKRRDD